MNFVEKLINSGYEAYKIQFFTGSKTEIPKFFVTKRDKFNPNDNFFGASIHEPDLILKNNDNEVVISLQGILAGGNDATPEIFEKYASLWNTCSIKYIKVRNKDNILHQSWSGEIPSDEIINKIL